MKINKKYLAGSAAALILSVCSYELGLYQARTVKENNRVSYIDGKQPSQKAETLTPVKSVKKKASMPNKLSSKLLIKAMSLHTVTTIIITMGRFLMMLSSVKSC